MDVTTAIDLINNHLTYKPGWVFRADDWEKRFEGTVRLYVQYPARNSNSEWAPLFAQEIQPYAHMPLVVKDIDSIATLFYRLVKIIMCIEEHEAREFLMYHATGGHDYFPVLHPHMTHTMRLWAVESLTDAGLPITPDMVNAYLKLDQTFGVV